LVREGKIREAEAEARTGVSLIEKQIRENPLTVQTYLLPQRELDLAATYLWANRFAKAAAWSERSVNRWTEYYKKRPQPEGTRGGLRWAHWHRAVALNWLDRGAEALAEMELSLRYTPEAERLNPQMNCARYMAKAGDHKGATKKVQEL